MAVIKKVIVSGCCFLWILLSLLFSQADLRALESRLSGANGEERLRLLVELTKRYRTNDLGKAYAYGVKALEVMRKAQKGHPSAHLSVRRGFSCFRRSGDSLKDPRAWVPINEKEVFRGSNLKPRRSDKSAERWPKGLLRTHAPHAGRRRQK